MLPNSPEDCPDAGSPTERTANRNEQRDVMATTASTPRQISAYSRARSTRSEGHGNAAGVRWLISARIQAGEYVKLSLAALATNGWSSSMNDCVSTRVCEASRPARRAQLIAAGLSAANTAAASCPSGLGVRQASRRRTRSPVGRVGTGQQ